MAAPNVLFTSDGIVNLDAKRRERLERSAGLMEWFRQFSDFAAHEHLGIHCACCQKDLVAKNSDSDRLFSTACECREWVGRNRDYVHPVIPRLA